jgi:pyrroloquinoline quinone (PQQ) biosynthesis protein C
MQGRDVAYSAAMSSTNFGDLVDVLDGLVGETAQALIADPLYGRLYDGTASRELYLSFLERTYQYVLYTPRQLDDAVRVLADSPDPVHQEFRAKFAHHSEEEAGHDLWLLDDIKALGGDVEAARRQKPTYAVQLYIVSLKTVLASPYPMGVLGFGYLLEGLAEKIGPGMADNLKRVSKIPSIAKAVSFVESHGVADVGHMAESRAAFRRITSDDDKAAIVLSARLTAAQYRSLLRP